MYSRQELDGLFKPVPVCTENMMVTWISLLISGVDWGGNRRGSPVFLSTFDFDSFKQHRITDGEDPLAALRATEYYYRTSALRQTISVSRSPFTTEHQLGGQPPFFESPLLFPFPPNMSLMTASPSSDLSLWVCTRFAVGHPIVEIHATSRVCLLFKKYQQRVADFLNQKLPHALKFWSQGHRTVLPEDVQLVEIDTDHSDVAFAMGWLHDNIRGQSRNGRQNHVALSMSRQDLIQSIHDVLSGLYDAGAERIVV